MPRFVLEIGTEELPPRYFPPALSQLHDGVVDRLAKARLTHGEVKVYGTPRRLALVVEEMAAVQAPMIREERGPSAKVAFDAEGKPTKAATGFARRHGIAPEDLVRRQTDQGEYVFAVIREPEAPAKDALAALLPDLITGLSFPKSMRWGAGTIRFGRPIRWLLALIDDQVVEFSVGEVHSGRQARGHPVLADGMFEVKHAKDYERALEGRFVLVEPEKRKAAIEKQLQEIVGSANARLVNVEVHWPTDPTVLAMFSDEFARAMHTDLLLQTMFLVEWPTAAIGTFDEAFLRLPRPILVEEMQHVQSYFPLYGQSGRLLPRFIAVRDGGEDSMENVVAGWESVLRAKLIDASYFYEQDLKRPLADRVEELHGVVFQENLGSMYEKMERVRAIAAALADAVGLSADEKAALDRAAMLCKADLTTKVVQDLSNLQGVMGGEYARRIEPSEPVEVADAIRDHYRPRFAGDQVPRTQLGKMLALSDKVDTITACFAVGIMPTGSADPYGLRREANGVLHIVLTMNQRVSLHDAIGRSLSRLADQRHQRGQPELAQHWIDIRHQVASFLRQRLEGVLRDEERIRYDLVAAVLAAEFEHANIPDLPDFDVHAAAEKARVLQSLSASPDFDSVLIACKRLANIAKGFPGGHVNEKFLREDAEKALWAAFKQSRVESDSMLKARDYGGMFEMLRKLGGPIDRYFNEVLVMDENEDIRRNRLATCWTINIELFRVLADFTLVVQA